MGSQVAGGVVGPVPGLQVGVASAKGSPGVTTLCLALGLAWPGPVVAGELDPAGADWAGRLPVGPSGGLAGLAAAARHGVGWEEVTEWLVPVTDTCSLLLGAADPVLSAGSVGVLAGALPEVVRSAGVCGVWDLGRLDRSSPAWAQAAACDVVVVALRASASGVAHALPLLNELCGDRHPRVGVVVMSARRGRRAHPEDEVADVIADRLGGPVAVLGRVPFDPLGVSMAEGLMGRWAGRCPLGTSARAVVGRIAELCDPDDGAVTDKDGGTGGEMVAVMSPSGVDVGDGSKLESGGEDHRGLGVAG